MIVSHRHRFVFLKTRKTASTSVEVFLRRFCGPDDIVTPVTPIDELVAVAAGHPPRNFTDDAGREAAYVADVAAGRLGKAALFHSTPFRFRHHMTMAELRAELGEAIDGYFVFTCERHPYDKAISRAGYQLGSGRYLMRGEARPADREAALAFLEAMVADGSIAEIANWPIYAQCDRIVADAVVLYEDLAAGLGAVLRRLGLDESGSTAGLPFLKRGLRPEGLSRAMLPETCRAAVREACAREFDAFGYAP